MTPYQYTGNSPRLHRCVGVVVDTDRIESLFVPIGREGQRDDPEWVDSSELTPLNDPEWVNAVFLYEQRMIKQHEKNKVLAAEFRQEMEEARQEEEARGKVFALLMAGIAERYGLTLARLEELLGEVERCKV